MSGRRPSLKRVEGLQWYYRCTKDVLRISMPGGLDIDPADLFSKFLAVVVFGGFCGFNPTMVTVSDQLHRQLSALRADTAKSEASTCFFFWMYPA